MCFFRRGGKGLLTSRNSVLRAINRHVSRYIDPSNLHPLWRRQALQRRRHGRVQAQRFVYDAVEMVQVGDVLVQDIGAGIGHVGRKLVAEFLYVFWVPGELEDDVG